MAQFFWGASTAAHQVEGGNQNDWAAWENGSTHLHNSKLHSAGTAADHFNRYEEDLDIMRTLHLKAYRFSVEWSRIEPAEGKFSEEALTHYVDVVQAARKRGIEPMVTLWHFSLPTWLSERGGWRSRQAAFYFERFAGKVAEALGEDVRYWFTMNEPEINISHAYVLGDYPPGEHAWYLYPFLVGRLMRAHRLAYAAIKRIDPSAQVGMAKDVFVLEPVDSGLINGFLKWAGDRFRNFYFFAHTRRQQDFIGINYYVRFLIDWKQLFKKEAPVFRDTGWEGAAEGLPVLLDDLNRRYGKPIIITENGTIDNDDSHRGRYIAEIVDAVVKARERGVPIFGYLHWTLLDCFEWTAGYSLRFGLVGVDREDGMKREVKDSAYVYRDLIDNDRSDL